MRDPPPAKTLRADLGHDADWLRNALKVRDARPWKSSRRNQLALIPHDDEFQGNRHVIKYSLAKLKGRLKVARRHEWRTEVCLSACPLAAIVRFWFWALTQNVEYE